MTDAWQISVEDLHAAAELVSTVGDPVFVDHGTTVEDLQRFCAEADFFEGVPGGPPARVDVDRMSFGLGVIVGIVAARAHLTTAVSDE